MASGIDFGLFANMRHNHDLRLFARIVHLGLQHGIHGDIVLGQNTGHIGQYAFLVFHGQTQVIAGLYRRQRQNRNIFQCIRLESQMRYAMLRIGGMQTGHVNQISHDGRAGRLGTGARAIVQG